MVNYTIKKMESEDEISGKAYVHYKSWQETYAGLIDAQYLAGMTLQKFTAITKKNSDNILVAKDGEKVIGFVGYGSYRDHTLAEYGEIYGIYVLTEYHGTQVGYELMNAALDMLAEYQRIALWVLKGNDRAIRFYKRYGFRFDETEKQVLLGTPNTELRMIFERSF